MLSLFCITLSVLFLLLVPTLWTLFPFSGSKHDKPRSKNSKKDGEEGESVQQGSDDSEKDGEIRMGLLRPELMPRHVAVIMDGNRRWAVQQGLTTGQGHEAGARGLVELAQLCFKWGIHTFSAFAFSTENWGRPHGEVNCLMFLFEKYLKLKIPLFVRERIRISVIGNLTKIPESLLRTIRGIEESTRIYTTKHIIIAIDYSGRYDISQACKRIVRKAKGGSIQLDDVDEDMIEKELLTKCTEFPNPDLLIRTSGEQRISNFYLWQSAYTEFFFSPVLWPDFGEDDFVEALISYQQRDRRFGQRA